MRRAPREETMRETIGKRFVSRFSEIGTAETLEDEIIKEFRLTIRLDGRDFAEAVVSPTMIREFMIGFLLTRRLISGLDDVEDLRTEGAVASARRRGRLRGAAPATPVIETTGGRNVDFTVFETPRPLVSNGPLVEAEVITRGVRMLSRMPLYNRTGGAHCAILFSSDGEPLVSAEDLGRHNSVDKTIGGGALAGVSFSDCWLAVSGRLPADMVIKPAIAGIPLIASVSAPTMDGVLTGENAGVTVIGFTRGERFTCYSHPERIKAPADSQPA